MQLRRTHALWGAIAVLAATPAGALAAGTKVSVRVEGLNKTLLAASAARTGSGSITKGGAPRGTCPANSAAGALNAATKGAWGGTFDTSFNELVLTSILGESWPFSQTNYYWGVWVDNRYASAGMCEISLHRGQRVLFAVDSVKHHEHPLALSAPRAGRVRHPFTVKAVWYTDAGRARAIRGVRVGGVTTNSRGIARITPRHAGRLRLKVSQKGYIRSAAEWVRISG
jgi:hypothetical protein